MKKSKKIDTYNDGIDEFIKVSDLYSLIMCGAKAANTVNQEIIKGNKVKLIDCVKDELYKLGITIKFKRRENGN